jgi:hypothetical protein
LGIATTLAANVAHGQGHGLISAVVAAWPAVANHGLADRCTSRPTAGEPPRVLRPEVMPDARAALAPPQLRQHPDQLAELAEIIHRGQRPE